MAKKNYIKDKKISILAQQKTVNEMYETVYVYMPMPGAENIWAYYRHASGKEQANSVLGSVNETKVEAIFKINWRDDIDEAMQIRFRGKDYQITGIDDFEGYKEDLTISAYVIKE